MRAPVYLKALWNTIVISGSVTLLCVFLGYPIAYSMAHAGERLRRLLIFVVLIPFWSSILVRTFAWMVLLQKRGLINTTLVEYLGLLETPLTLIYNRTGVLIGMSHILLPFMILPLYSVLSRIEPNLSQAAASLGAPPVRNFVRVYLPLSLPGLLAGSVLVFVMGLGYYITPALLGGTGRHNDRTADRDADCRLRQLGSRGRAGSDFAARHGNDIPFHQPLVDRGRPMTGLSSDRVWPFLRAVICLAIIIFLIAPMVIVVIVSFSSAPFLTFPPPGLSLQWYRKLASLPVWLDAISTSATIMVPSALIATAAGTAAAVGLARGRIPGAGAIASLIMAPMVVPVIITAAAMLGVFRAWGLQGTLLGLILAHATLAIPYVVFTVLAAMRLVDDQLESAALTLGATHWRAFWRVTFPLILPAVLSGLLFAMVISFDELVVSIFLSSPTVRPVTVQMWSDVRGDVDPTIAAIGALLLAFSVGVLLLEAVLNRERAKPLTPEAESTAIQRAAP